MVNLKTKDMGSKNKEELNNKLVELRKEMMKDNTQITTGTVPKSPGQVKMNKKIIARILTLLNESEKSGKKEEVKKKKIEKKETNDHKETKKEVKKETGEKIN